MITTAVEISKDSDIIRTMGVLCWKTLGGCVEFKKTINQFISSIKRFIILMFHIIVTYLHYT